ncbi:hypothetical protein [Paenibacillus xylaniclasticus]|uniref:hypothetical protein n=1 Tax=Paenibacillus xylaniclasticus TaxID=588083 RepID=UPI000FD8147C|nr:MULTISPECIES: hypothetical protein [Paenibacillus]GFN32600.1 hypothetical protein PCURB6_28600 [Paenibacillus curdlanolyticus]
MGAPNSWVIRDVPKMTFVDVSTRKPLFYLSDLKTSQLENTAETVYARGGTGNPKIVGFSSNREAKLNVSNAVFDNAALAMMTGNNVLKGAKPIQQRDVLVVNSNSATLKYTPANTTGAIVAVFKKNPDGSHGEEINYTSTTVATGQYTRTAKVLNFFAGDLPNNSEIIAYYNTNTDATAQTITISSDKFAGSFGLVLDAVVKSPYDQKDYYAQINIWAAKMEDNWSIAMAADGDPSEHSMPIELLKQAGRDDLYTITLYDGNLLT